MCVFVFLLILAVVIAYFLLRASRPPGAAALVCGFFVLCGLALLLLYAAAASGPRDVRESWFFLAMVGSGIFLFVWRFRRGRRAALSGLHSPTCPPVGRLKDLLAERLPPR